MKYCFTLALVLILTISLHGVDLMKRTRRRKRATCSYQNHINGCSVPGNLPFIYKERFTPACNEHDVCYFCVGVKDLVLKLVTDRTHSLNLRSLVT